VYDLEGIGHHDDRSHFIGGHMDSWKNRHIKSELAHNLAIVFWISANAYWMISEFFHFDYDECMEGFYRQTPCLDTFFYRSIDTAILLCCIASKRIKGKTCRNYVARTGFFFLY
jgi:hypothetical protein